MVNHHTLRVYDAYIWTSQRGWKRRKHVKWLCDGAAPIDDRQASQIRGSRKLPSAVVSAKAARQDVSMTDRNIKGPIAHDHLPVLPGLEALNPFYKNPKVYTPCFGGLGHINCPRAGSTTNEDPREILVSTNVVTEVWKL
ncbi:hypothetical protein TESG_08531 [Trichophyton tonsurans CBS 112818]|uniref:Uncharacterized protein n=1 Tax=Trichophyton tonsurans (strain CBS 112818) TaxID=647933 RepID=F2S3I3_TRIT1|nr:hypothetical protein TESG_08531 [Trichophyton tonsurans CBS 112818]